MTMERYYAHYDNQTGQINGLYVVGAEAAVDVERDENGTPTPNVEIKPEEWAAALNVRDRMLYSVKGGALTRRGPTLEEAKAAKLDEIANARFEAETGGVDVQGTHIATDRESQALITGAALQATQDAGYKCQWKAKGGFTELTAEKIKAVAVAVRAHVQSCFDKEKELVEKVNAAETVEAVEAISWPEAAASEQV